MPLVLNRPVRKLSRFGAVPLTVPLSMSRANGRPYVKVAIRLGAVSVIISLLCPCGRLLRASTFASYAPATAP